jgi:hypothetical protein
LFCFEGVESRRVEREGRKRDRERERERESEGWGKKR